MTRTKRTTKQMQRIADLEAVVGHDGTDDLGVIVDHADPDATTDELVAIVVEAREDAAREAAPPRQVFRCLRCGWVWIARRLPVRLCANPKCRSPRWDVPRAPRP